MVKICKPPGEAFTLEEIQHVSYILCCLATHHLTAGDYRRWRENDRSSSSSAMASLRQELNNHWRELVKLVGSENQIQSPFDFCLVELTESLHIQTRLSSTSGHCRFLRCFRLYSR